MQRLGGERRIGWMALVLGLCLARAAPASGATGQITFSTWKGLTLSVDAQWLDSGGYRPVKVTLTPATPPTADRSFHLEFSARTPYSQRAVIVSQELDLPAGSANATITLRIPQCFAWQYYELNVWEDGRHLKDLSQQRITIATGQDWAEGLPNLLVVADKATSPPALPVIPAGMPIISRTTVSPERRSKALASLLPTADLQQLGFPNAATLQGGAAYLPVSMTLPLNELPDSWLDYTGLDIVCISLDQARQMAAEESTRWRALRAWVAAGGNLLVSGAPADSPRLAELDRLLDEPRSSSDDADLASRGWVKPPPECFKRELPPPFGATRFSPAAGSPGVPAGGMMPGGAPGMPGAPAGAAPVEAPQANTTPGPLHDPPFVSRKHSLGLVVAVAADDLFARGADQWLGMLNTIGVDRWIWFLRHGFSPQRENRDFWNWPIPGVGLAPVTAFQVLITAFVIAIGPLNYWWLRRRGKLHLLVIAVPLSAALVTLALFTYAVAVDGLGVRVRSRSFTLLNQRTGQAACWARTSYYAGLAPSDGLKFSDDVAVMALLPQSGDERLGENRRRALSWSPGEQHLASGWLASRTPTQLFTVRSRFSPAALQVKMRSGASPPEIKNQLGVRIERLLLADDQGNCFRGESIAPDGAATLAAAALNDEAVWFRQLYDRRRPAFALGFDRNMPQRLVSRARFRWRSPGNNALPAAALSTSVLERELASAMQGFARLEGGKPVGLAPRSYVAIVERSPEAEYGVDAYEEAESLHVVAGRW